MSIHKAALLGLSAFGAKQREIRGSLLAMLRGRDDTAESVAKGLA
jgi:hypothetical protein